MCLQPNLSVLVLSQNLPISKNEPTFTFVSGFHLSTRAYTHMHREKDREGKRIC